jgi:type I restriction enzyme R subunit
LTTSSKVKLTIQDVLDTGLPRAYSKEIYEENCVVLFEHFYENYPDQAVSTYAMTG